MFCAEKNSYLQLVTSMNPRIINKAVDQAMERSNFEKVHYPSCNRLESMQPSLFAPHVDITRARMGFGRTGLKLLVRDLHAPNPLKQMQALHSLMDEVQDSESTMFLLKQRVVYRLIDLMHLRNPVVREKVCLTLTHLATYQQGLEQIMCRPMIIENLLYITLRDKKEIRYAAAYTLRTLSREKCAAAKILENELLIETILKIVVNEHTGIVEVHLKTLANLFDWDQAKPLKLNAFQVMLSLFNNEDPRIVCGAMDCVAQLLKHEIGRQLADIQDLNFQLKDYLRSPHIEVIISTVSLMKVTTLTTRSKWRAKEICTQLTERLVKLCYSPNKPILQLDCMQVLINLCDCPDIRYHMKAYWENKVKNIRIRTHEEWDGTSETTSYGLETGHNYRTMCIENVETIKNEFGDNALALNVHSYLSNLCDVKNRLIKAINWKPYRD